MSASFAIAAVFAVAHIAGFLWMLFLALKARWHGRGPALDLESRQRVAALKCEELSIEGSRVELLYLPEEEGVFPWLEARVPVAPGLAPRVLSVKMLELPPEAAGVAWLEEQKAVLRISGLPAQGGPTPQMWASQWAARVQQGSALMGALDVPAWARLWIRQETGLVRPAGPLFVWGVGAVFVWAMWQDHPPFAAGTFLLVTGAISLFVLGLVWFLVRRRVAFRSLPKSVRRGLLLGFVPGFWAFLAGTLLALNVDTGGAAVELAEWAAPELVILPLPTPLTYWARVPQDPYWVSLRAAEYERLQYGGGPLRLKVRRGWLGFRYVVGRL